MAFIDTITGIEELFSDWNTNNKDMKMYPQNYQGKISGKKWIRMNIFQGGSTLRYQGDQFSNGFVLFNIFVPVGKGIREAHTIADKIAEVISKKTTISGVQTTNSFLTTVGVDTDNSGLFRLDYTINFNSYN